MNVWIEILVCLLAGAGAGFGTGFAGMSAAAIIAPFLTAFLNVPVYEAVGIGLASDVLASAVSAATYKKNKNLDLKNAVIMMLSVLAMTVVGSILASRLHETAMGNTLYGVLIFMGLRFIVFPTAKTREDMRKASKTVQIIKSVIGGAVVGFICGFVGAGGGMMMLFVLTSFLGYELHVAVGTSVFIMSFTALTGSVSHFVIGGVHEILPLCLCIVFTLGFALLASVIANRVKTKTLNRIIGVVLLLFGVTLFLFDNL